MPVNSLYSFVPASQFQSCEFLRLATIFGGVRGSCDRLDIGCPTK